MTDERDCEHCKHYKDMLIGIGIDEHIVKCCELWDCEKELEQRAEGGDDNE